MSVGDEQAGVPLGGIGAGCLEMGRDGRFRNATIHNNLAPGERIPRADAAFLAVRMAAGRDLAVRVLQSKSSLPFEQAGIRLPFVPPQNIEWQALYPKSGYRLKDDDLPAEVRWRGTAPVVPYDTEASTLPLVILEVDLVSRSPDPLDAAVIFNWEDLRGAAAPGGPPQRAPIQAVAENEEGDLHSLVYWPRESPPVLRGLSFNGGDRHTIYAVYAHAPDAAATFLTWDASNPAEIKNFWWTFYDAGQFPNRFSQTPAARHGALCVSGTVQPDTPFRAAFLLAWRSPERGMGGRVFTPGYAKQYQSAIEVAEYGRKHIKYLTKAVDDWHGRLLRSTFPQWFARMLINGSSVLTTNLFIRDDAAFALLESPAAGAEPAWPTRLFASLGLLLFFPDLAHRGIAQTLDRREGPENTDFPWARDPNQEYEADDAAATALEAYRNFIMTGRLSMAQHWFPALHKLADRMGPPNGGPAPRPGTPLRTVALYALADFAHRLNRLDEATELVKRARTLHDTLHPNHWTDLAQSGPTDDGTLELAGPVMAEFLRFRALFPIEEIGPLLDALHQSLQGWLADSASDDLEHAPTPTHLAGPQHQRPDFLAGILAPALIYAGRPDAGLAVLKALYRSIHLRRRRAFNQPDSWELQTNDATPAALERHIGALAAWHAFYAFQGLHFDAHAKTLAIAPNLPEGVNHLSAPLFTPLGFGWMVYQVNTGPRYKQMLRLSFDSPTPVHAIRLAIPKERDAASVTLTADDGPRPARTHIQHGHRANTLSIEPRAPLLIQDPIGIVVE